MNRRMMATLRITLFAAAIANVLAAQGISAPPTVTAGGAILVRVGTNDATVQVSDGSPGNSSYPVPPSKQVEIPVPASVPAGTILCLKVGKGLRAQILFVEVL